MQIEHAMPDREADIEAKLQRLVIDILTTLLEIFTKSGKLIKKERLKMYLSVTFLSGTKKITEVKERLESLVQNETRLIGSPIYSATKRSEKKFEDIESLMNGRRFSCSPTY